MIVTIDGPAGAGKSSVAKAVARRHAMSVLDTGAMYRACALAVLEDGGDPNEHSDAIVALHHHDISVEPDGLGGTRTFLDGCDVTDELHTPELDQAVTPVCQVRAVRTAMTIRQRLFARRNDCVCEGRDMGTVVFPDADVKVWLTADAEERARRRVGQFGGRDYEDVLEDIRRRDDADAGRDLAPMAKAEDAITVDTTGMSFDEVVRRVDGLVRRKQKPE